MTDSTIPSGPDLSNLENLAESRHTDQPSNEGSKDETINSKPLKDAQNIPKTLETTSSTISNVQNSHTSYQNATQIVPQISLEQQLQKSKKDLESMVLKYAKSERENLQNINKVTELDKKLKRAIKDNDQLANRIKLLTNDKNQLTDTLNAKVAQLTVLEQKNLSLNSVQGVRLKEYEEKIKSLETTNESLLKQIESYKSKEGELLDFSERIAMKHMILQSELDEALKRAPIDSENNDTIIQERDNLIKQVNELIEQNKSLTENLKAEQDCLNSIRTEKETNDIKYRASLDELRNEIKVMRRKHQIATKELVKEVKQLQAQLGKVMPKSDETESEGLTA